LVTAPDRLARNYVHQMVLLEELERGGCRVEFLDRPMSQDPHDHLLLQIRGAVAEYERTLIAERMRRGRLRKLRAGVLLPWTRPPRLRRSALQPVGPRQESTTPVTPAGWLPVAPVPALVSQEQFGQVQAKLAHNRQFARRHNTTHLYLLRALVSCGACHLAC